MDRLILTGTEGAGKTTLFRQFAVCVAAGVHPFNHQRIPPHRVLMIDCENSARQSKRAFRAMATQANRLDPLAGDRLFIENRPDGIDLTKPATEAWFLNVARAVQPAIIFTGSLYKLHNDDPNDERPAKKVQAALDRIRTATDAALVIEAHSGKAQDTRGNRQVAPIGASVWLRWPEFGYGIRPAEEFTPENRLVEMLAWRGDRDQRSWPKRMKAGGVWPWERAEDPDDEWRPRRAS